ncbi:MAG: TolB family protein, partial [Candidatus Methylomirabilales bacterium]
MGRFVRLVLIVSLLASAVQAFSTPGPAEAAEAGASANGASLMSSVSADARFVAFASEASNLIWRDTNGAWDIFVRDRLLPRVFRVSVSSLGGEAHGPSLLPSLSSDGRRVAFSSLASNLAEGDSNGTWDIFVRDLPSGITIRASVDSSGSEGREPSAYPAISADGWHVAFSHGRSGVGEIYVRDLLRGTTTLVSAPAGGASPNGQSEHPSISAEGRYVAYSSLTSDLVEGDRNGAGDVFVF